MKPRSAKAKGTRLEVEVVKLLEKQGIEARRQPGSGIYPDFPHDVELKVNGKRYIVECKARKSGFATLDRWKGQADLLVVKVDRGDPIVYLPLRVLGEIIRSGGDHD